MAPGAARQVTVGLLDTAVDTSDVVRTGATVVSERFDSHGRRSGPHRVDGPKHGTAIARSICSTAGTDAPIRLAAADVLEEGLVVARIVAGLEWVAEQGADVVCLPFGTREPSPVLHRAIKCLRDDDVVVIAASGNRGAGHLESPADAPHVLAVGAHDEHGRPARHSGSSADYGGHCRSPDVLAPNEAVGTNDEGTSFAAAHVARCVANLRTAHPPATADEVVDAVVATAGPLGSADAHRARAGVIDAAAAHERLRRRDRVPGPTFAPRTPWAGRFVDPLLAEWLATGRADTTMTAIAVAVGRGPDALDQLLSRAATGSGVAPAEIRLHARIETAIVRGPVAYLRALADDVDTAVLSAATVRRSLPG